ncbi:hypothetical protein [Lichenibacterium dinghuense]|uniref:hypothetical protein n=1 Tax=Lichenibacterium dinghuense TaxID=2895977 RepID=UPI001F45664A|nr:hypothetical protein [Lichenibacterium sp. 6Y81]
MNFDVIDDDYRKEKREQKSGRNLCDCLIAIGPEQTKWYPSINKDWCRRWGAPGTDIVGHVKPLGYAKKYP